MPDSATAIAFAALAERFCALIEAHPRLSSVEFLHQTHALLPLLYAGGLGLPDVSVDGEPDGAAKADDARAELSDDDCDRAMDDEMRALCRGLGERIGAERDFYAEVFDPYSDTREPVIGSLADDLADIYRDLVDGLRAWRSGDRADAVWRWRFGFQVHWGEHATSALRALHARAAWHEPGFPPPRNDRGSFE